MKVKEKQGPQVQLHEIPKYEHFPDEHRLQQQQHDTIADLLLVRSYGSESEIRGSALPG
jgi:hypothetical protein